MWQQNKWFILAVVVFLWLVVVTRYERCSVTGPSWVFDRVTATAKQLEAGPAR
jgi:hypothetical protein